ncbi:GPI ethanolamine phosphate transferase 1 isoform X3 [Atheta coriaria]
MTKTPKKQTKFRNLWILGICIHILTFLFVLDLYFTSPIKHGMTPHKSRGEPFAKRLVVFIADGMRAEAIYPMQNWDRVKYLSELRLNKSCSWGIVHTGVPTESRPGHVAIFGGLMEDPSALFTGWQANTVEFDSVINESNYAWSYGSPDIVKIFTKKDKAKLNVEYYDPSEEDFSGRTSTINLDTWVFDRVEELLTPKGNSCQAEFIRKKTQRRRMNELNLSIAKERAQCQLEKEQCKGPHHECYKKTQPCFERVSDKEIEATLKEADIDFEQFQLYPCIHKFDKIECEQLCKTGNVFFLHLLGMDTAGHVHKPDSKEYIDNLHAVDKGIRETSFLFEEFFNDNETAFLVTADHGMTNWGSHGDGSEHETEVPYILWGKGVKENKLRHDLKQTDLAPLLSSLIGVPIPVNSIGILPHKLLNGTYDQISEAVMANVMQHVEQYTLLRREFDLDPLFTEYPMFENNYVGHFITKMETLLKRGDREKNVVRMGEEFMKDILAANAYMRNYYFRPKVITVMLGFFLWIIYLSLSIHVRDEVKPIPTFRSCRIGMRFLTVLLLIAAVYYLNSLKVKCFTYTYPVFLLSVLALFFEDEDVVNQLWIILNMPNKTTIIARTIVYGVLVQLLVFGFFNRMFCAGVVVILAFWLTQNDCAMKSKVTWLITTCTLALLQMLEPSTKFNYYGLAIGSFLWLVIYISYIYAEGREYIKRFDLKYKTMTTNIIMTPLVLYLVSAANALHVAYAFDSEIGLSDMNLVISWVVTAAILFLIPVAPKGVLTRFGHICASLIIPYTLMAVNIDLIFYSVLVLTLYYWMEIESKMELPSQNKNPLKELHFLVKYIPSGSVKVPDLYRRTYFYLALTVCYFFAIGNMASFNGFDPQWTRTYVATFNPFLMAALIVIKMIIPFFLITCAFYAIVLHSKANDTKVFTVLLLFLDQMVLNFMLFVRNEGSWLEIGKSLSHFAVMEAMAVVMLVFYAIARYVCSFRIGDAGTGYEPLDEIQEDSETNIQNLIEEGVCKRVKGAQKRKIKTKWWYLHDLISNSCKKSPIKSYGVKSSRSDTSMTFPSSFFDYYVKGKDKTFESNRLESNLCVQSEKFKSQEVQCKFEDEINISSNSKKHKTQKSSRSVKNFEKILSGTKKRYFKWLLIWV